MSVFLRPLLLLTDRCDPLPAFRRAVELARAADAELAVLDVSDAAAAARGSEIRDDVLDKLAEAAVERRRRALAELTEQAQREGVQVSATFAAGPAFRVAIQTAIRDRHDVVLKTIDHREPHARATHGSTDKHLLRKCPCPVWLVEPGGEKAGAPVVAAVNADPHDAQDRELGAAILRTAAAIGALDGVALDVVYAWRVFGELLLRGPEPLVSDKETDALMGRTLNRHVNYLDELIESTGLAGITARPHVVHSRPAGAIVDFVQSRPTRLLVIGTVGRTGLSGLLIGNTAEEVLSEVTCSVLALKPRGFVSPVTLDA